MSCTRLSLTDRRKALIIGLALFAMTLAPRSAWGQWLTSGSSIYYNNGYVGIGTPPALSLHVKGSLNLARFESSDAWSEVQIKSNNGSPNAALDFTDSNDALIARFQSNGSHLWVQNRSTGDIVFL